MEQVEKLAKPIPKVAEHRISDLLSENSSPSAKGNAARWYAEMFIDLFLSDRAKLDVGENEFNKMFLGEKIRKIQSYVSPEIVSALYEIKEFGDKASHYSPGTVILNDDAEKIVDVAINLIIFVLVDELKKDKLNSNLSRATIFSTIFPVMRERVLLELLEKASPLDEYNLFILHKYCLACVKNNKFNKARRLLDSLKKKKFIDSQSHRFEIESIKEISARMRADELPIPGSMEDVSRNFNNVISKMPEFETSKNARLISIIETLVRDVFPSNIGSYVGNQVFIVGS